MKMPQRVKILAQETCYQGFFRIERYRIQHQKYDGSLTPPLTREVFERGHAAAVLPYDPVTDEVLLIEQFRIGALDASGGPWLVEIIAGMTAPGETPEQVVQREAMEEAGCEILDLLPVCDYLVSPGGTSERIALFCGKLGRHVSEGVFGCPDEHEDIRVTKVSFDMAYEKILSGEINSASPIIALQWLKLNRESVRQLWA